MDDIRYSLFDNRFLELILLPTERCNFRCVYCYEPLNGSDMPPDVFRAIVMLIRRRYNGLSLLRIGWFGGEPLLSFKEIVNFTREVKNVLGRSFADKYISHMSTNGYLLTLETAGKLIELNTNVFQISLDGTSQWHDRTRILRDGSGTFDRIWKNLMALHESDLNFKINLRIHIHKYNVPSIVDLLDMISSVLAGDDRFKVYLRPLSNLGSPKGDVSDLYLDRKTSNEIIDMLRTSRGFMMSEALRDCDEYICYAARPTCFVIRPDGRVVKCTIGLDDPENLIGRINNDGSLIINQIQIRKWINGAMVNDSASMRCPRNYVLHRSHSSG